MMDQIDNSNFIEEAPRPGFLTVLCVLSFITTGLSLISGLFSFVSGPSSEEEMLVAKVQMTKSISELKEIGMTSFVDMMEKLQAMTAEVNDHFYLAGIVGLITAGVGLFGVIKMWQGFKLGFHIYIVYCILGVVGAYLYVSPGNIPSFIIIFNVIISAIFVFMYSRNLHWMNK